jgi:hypothetical protein
MKKIIAILSLITAITANAFDFSIVGSGSTQTQGSATPTQFATGLRFETFVTDAISIGAVQSFGVNATNNVAFNSEAFAAYNINYKVFGVKNTVFAGGDVNLAYGEGIQPAWQAGPILGNRLFLSDNVYVLGQVSYDVALNSVTSNQLRYTLGLAFRF